MQTTVDVKERPILFSAEMVKAILGGTKTQTRRVIKPQPDHFHKFGDGVLRPQIGLREISCPYGQPGDQLWVREAFRMGKAPGDEPGQGVALYADRSAKFHPDMPEKRYDWCREYKPRPSIHMPRWASRLTLEIVNIRLVRLQDISEEDAKAEGVRAWSNPMPNSGHVYVPEFINVWNKINGKRTGCSWDDSPWVWAVTFRRLEAPNVP
jgi:hypothetical protein